MAFPKVFAEQRLPLEARGSAMSAAQAPPPLSVSDATRRILEDLGLDTMLRGKAALRAAREELGLEPAPTDSKLRANLQEVATELGIELGWAPAVAPAVAQPGNPTAAAAAVAAETRTGVC